MGGFRGGVVALSAALLLGGCLAGDGDDSLGREETAEAWVAALNAKDYERACTLSVQDDDADCVEMLKQKPFGEDLKVEGVYSNESEGASGDATFAISSADDRKPTGTGWIAYAPVDGFSIERDDGEYRVHFEVSVIK